MMKRRPFYIFFAVLAFLMLSAPQNHCEAEDAYYYARMVEQGAWSEMFHQHHLLYLPIARGVVLTVQQFGVSVRALPVLIAMSMVSAAWVICFFAALLRRSGQSRLWVLPLLFSYGFWRYACAAEIYLPALAAVSGAWFFALRPKGMPWAIFCSVLALLLHLVCLPAVVAVGLLFIFQKQWKRAGLYFVCTGVAVAGVYGLVLNSVGAVVFQDAQSVRSSLFEASTWLKGLFAFGQNVLSGNFLFSIPPVAEKLAGLFPHHMLQEEFFMGRQAGAFWSVLSMVTFAGALLLLGAAVRKCFRLSSLFDWALAVWLGGNVAMDLLFEPANPELWIFTLLPFWFLVSNGFGRSTSLTTGRLTTGGWTRASASATADKSADKEPAPHVASKHWKFLFPALVAAMLLHNAIGGMAFVKSKKGDYCRQKAAWIVEHASAEDQVVMADSHSFSTYVQYWSPVQVIDAKFQGLENRPSGQVFVYGDVMDPLPAVLHRGPESVARLRAIREKLGAGLIPVHEADEWKIYEWCLTSHPKRFR